MKSELKDISLQAIQEEVAIAKAKQVTTSSRLHSGLELKYSKSQLVISTLEDGSKKEIKRIIFVDNNGEEYRLTPNVVAKFVGTDVFSNTFAITNVQMQGDTQWLERVDVKAVVVEQEATQTA